MKLLTKAEVLSSVASSWKQQYCRPDGTWEDISKGSSEAIYKKLISLQQPETKESAIDEIIGNKSWTRLVCNECESEVDAVVQLGEASDYESHTVNVCVACLYKAINLIV